MSFLKTIAVNGATGDVLELYQCQQGPYGFVPNYAKVWCYRPELMQAWADLQRGIKKRADFKNYCLVTLAASLALKSSGCALAFAKNLLNHSFSTEDIVDIVNNDGKNNLSAKEHALVAFAKLVVKDATAIKETDIENLRKVGCSEEEIFDAVVVASARCFFAKIHDALGVLVDSPYLNWDQALLELLTVGRPISNAAVERLQTDNTTVA